MLAPSGQLALAKDFDPNFIISDAELQDHRSMSLPDINSFLSNKGGFIGNLSTEDASGTRRGVGEIIFNAAEQYKINPKYLLVKLQKEQSLVTDKDPSPGQLDWATGYSVCDGCNTSDPAIQKNKGLGKQIDSAAGIMRWYYDNSYNQSWIKKANTPYLIDNTTVIPATLATAFLYTYTPHLQGNQNFWKLWQTWFDQVYPDGTLLRADNSEVIYILEDGKKRPFKSISVLASRYDPKYIVATVLGELARYPDGAPISLPNYSILKNNDSYYLLDDDTLRPFANGEAVRKFGYNPDEIISVQPADIVGYKTGTAIGADDQNITGRLIKLDVNGALYYIKGKSYYSVADPQIAPLRYPNLNVVVGKLADLAGLTSGGMMSFPDGTLVGTKINGKVFVLEKGRLRHIASEEVFIGLGYDWKNIVWIDDISASSYQIGEPLYLRQLPADNQTVNGENQGLAQLSPTSTANQSDKANIPYTEIAKPLVFPETGKMVSTPANDTDYFGDSKFSTPINTYLVASYGGGEEIKILAGKNIDTPRPIASFTKVMTAYELFDEKIDLAGITTYNPKVDNAPAGNLFKIASGDQVRNRDLFDSLLVSSLNRPAKMLVKAVGATESEFVRKMNNQARAWGLSKTFFSDSHGYDLGNQSTAREYLTIFGKAIDNTTIKEYLGTTDYVYDELTSYDSRVTHRDTHTNKIALKADLPYEVIASKTGFLNEAGYGIAMLVRRNSDGRDFILITMGNPNYSSKFSETEKLALWVMRIF